MRLRLIAPLLIALSLLGCAPSLSPGAQVVRTGHTAEEAVRAAYDIGEKVPIVINGKTRIPDGMTATTITEVKNVARLSYTKQLRDLAEYARKTGRRFDLYVRRDTVLSGPLQEAVEQGLIHLRFIP